MLSTRREVTKISEIVEFKRLTSFTKFRSFLGLTGFYRKFIPKYSKEIVPFCKLLKKNVKFEWSEDCESAFKFFKEQLQSPELLSYPDFSSPFILQIDASDFALGYVLAQEEDDALLLIRYGGRILLPLEIRYAPTEKEVLVIFYGVKRELGGHFHINLHGTCHFQGIIFQHKFLNGGMKIDQKFRNGS